MFTAAGDTAILSELPSHKILAVASDKDDSFRKVGQTHLEGDQNERVASGDSLEREMTRTKFQAEAAVSSSKLALTHQRRSDRDLRVALGICLEREMTRTNFQAEAVLSSKSSLMNQKRSDSTFRVASGIFQKGQ